MKIKKMEHALNLYTQIAWHYTCLKGKMVDLKNNASRKDVLNAVNAGHFTLETVLEKNKKNVATHGPPLIKALYELGYFDRAEKIAREYGLPLSIDAEIVQP